MTTSFLIYVVSLAIAAGLTAIAARAISRGAANDTGFGLNRWDQE